MAQALPSDWHKCDCARDAPCENGAAPCENGAALAPGIAGMLRQRSDFVCMRDCGTLIRTRTMLLQIARIAAPPAAGKYPVFVGVTASKKVGGAVVRNFAKRRLRAIFRQELLMRLSGVPADSFRMLARVKLSKRTLELPSDPVVVGGSEQFGLSIVLIATRHTVDVPWQALVADFQHALGRTHCGAQAKSG